MVSVWNLPLPERKPRKQTTVLISNTPYSVDSKFYIFRWSVLFLCVRHAGGDESTPQTKRESRPHHHNSSRTFVLIVFPPRSIPHFGRCCWCCCLRVQVRVVLKDIEQVDRNIVLQLESDPVKVQSSLTTAVITLVVVVVVVVFVIVFVIVVGNHDRSFFGARVCGVFIAMATQPLFLPSTRRTSTSASSFGATSSSSLSSSLSSSSSSSTATIGIRTSSKISKQADWDHRDSPNHCHGTAEPISAGKQASHAYAFRQVAT